MTDQIRYVSRAQEDERLKSMGWKQIPLPPEPKRK
jgi:hypothetical protein